jgi:hypothetical protein
LVVAAWSPARAAEPIPLTGSEASLAQVNQLRLLATGYPDEFAGVYTDAATHVVHVRVVAGANGARRVQAALNNSTMEPNTFGSTERWKVLLEPAKYGQRELDQTMARVTTQQPWASAAADRLSLWYVDPRVNRVIAGLTSVTPQLRQTAQAAFGDRVTVRESPRLFTMESATKTDHVPTLQRVSAPARSSNAAGTAGHASVAAVPTRLLDAVPYWGGDRIVSIQTVNGSTYIVQCTAALEFSLQSGLAMSSAGHCGPQGTDWMQGYFDGSQIRYTGNIGTVSANVQWGNGQTDAEMMAGSSWAPHVYIDSTNSIPVGGRIAVGVTDQVCTDGSVSNLTCIGVVNAANACVTLHDGLHNVNVNECHMNVATAVGGSSPLSQPGDSGGPVFFQAGGRAYGQGIISGGTSDHLTVVFSDMNYLSGVYAGTPSVAP